MIESIQEAFQIIDTTHSGVPFDAIKYLYNHPKSPEIHEKICFALDHAYDQEIYYDKDTGLMLDIPLWYAVVSENHLHEDFIERIINLFTKYELDWDFLNEQGAYLVGRLCSEFPEVAPIRFFDAIESQINQKSQFPYLYLFDALLYLNIAETKDRIIALLEAKSFKWIEIFYDYLADVKLQEALPYMERLIENAEPEMQTELSLTFKRFKEEEDYIDAIRAFSNSRPAWEEHYKELERYFKNKESILS